MADEIAKWLDDLGLGQYAQSFADNAIETGLLPKLTDEDLKEIGVAALGHRKRLMEAIEALRPAGRHAAPDTGPTPAEERDSPDPERRHLTVLFCDLVGSTALSSRLDPEDMREVIRGYQDAVASVVARYEGYVAKFMGDGVLAYFGYPRAFEDDAERAIHVGLETVEAVGRLSAPGDEPLAVRIGIATGSVVVGDIVGEGSAQEAAITGETPNLAARLQEIAEPGSVVIGEATHALSGGLFETEGLGRLALKGFDSPVAAWSVTGRRQSESRFVATRGERLTELVGRDEEMEILLRRWERAKAGEGQVVLVSGEPGIGKSRLARELEERIAGEAHHRLRYQCSPYHTNSALHPIIEHFERALRTEAGNAATTLNKLEALLAPSGWSVAEAAPLLAALLSIPADGRYPPLEVSPQRQKELTLNVLVDQLAGLAGQRPVLFLMEDAHWIDPTTLELIELTIERAPGLPLLALVTHRPEFAAPWVGRPRVTSMILGRLDGRDCERMVERVAAEAALAPGVRDQIVTRTDGVPLFVEELTKSVLEATSGPAQSPTAVEIPATLQDSFEARLDRLGPVKEIAQVGAVIGREFSYELIAAIAPLGEDALARGLRRLAEAEIVFVRGTPPDALYTFKHALLQDTAYNSLLRSRRAELHRRIAEGLQAQFPDRAEADPELLARHYTAAGRIAEAIDWWTRAGRAAAERFANREAVDHLDRALAMVREADELPDRAQRELAIQSTLGPTLLTVHGFGSRVAAEAFERARELSTEIGDSEALFRAVWGIWLTQGQSGSRASRGNLVGELLDLADRSQDSVHLLQARHAGWGNPFEKGDQAQLEHIERGLEVYDPSRHVATARVFGGHDAGVCGLVHAALTLWSLGYPDQARDRSRRGRELAGQIGYPPARAQADSWSAQLHFYGREWPEARRLAESGIRVGRDCGALQFVHSALPIYGLTLVMLGETEAGLEAFDDSVRVFRDYHLGQAFRTALKAEAYAAMGRPEEALPLVSEAIAIAEQGPENSWTANSHLLKGEILRALSPDRPSEAEACFETAIEVARAQGTRMWELRAANRLARLWQSQGRTAAARDLLAPVYGWFTEGFDTVDLKDAKGLLNELR